MSVQWQHTPDGLEEQTKERRGCAIKYWLGGPADGDTVVLLHGATMDHRMFNAQVPLLLKTHRVLVWDARGHGLSQPFGIDAPTVEDYVDDMLAILDDARIDTAVFIGQSLGAYISQHLIRRHPQRAAGLVVIGSTPIAFPLTRFEHAAVQLSPVSFRLWPLGHLRRSMAKITATQDDVRQYALDAMSMISKPDLVRIFRAAATAVRRKGHPAFRVDVPFLLTHGEHDSTGTIRRDAPRWAGSDYRIEYVVIPEAGHNANQDNPRAFNRALLGFLPNAESD